jgi:hypothetical protein
MTKKRALTSHRLLALALVGVSFFLNAHINRTVFERLPHLEDELAYLYQARIFAGGNVYIGSPDLRVALWQPFVIDEDGKRFSKYTPGWSAILALGVVLGAPWWINITLGAATVALVYRTGEEIFNADVGLIAAFLLTFSPMFLLLNGSLMGHTAALFAAALFTYTYWRIEQEKRAVGWSILAGVALGLLIANRPLTAIGVTTPFVAYSLLRLAYTLFRSPRLLLPRLLPLTLMTGIALVFALSVPLYRYAVVGDITTNTYTLVWEYDKVGFGEDHGRFGHTLEKGIRHAREDLTLTASDMFGWQAGPLNYEQRQHLLIGTREYPGRGLSWLLLPFGIITGLLMTGPRKRWTLVLVAVLAAVVGVHLAYWIGSQRYSTRYYFEGLAAAALISAILPGWLAAQSRYARPLIYLLLAGVTAYAATVYTFPRLNLLHGFNNVKQGHLDEINAMRQTDKPVVVILTGNAMTWRSNGTLMGVTSPYLDSDIVLARDSSGRYHERIVEQFADREIIELNGLRSKSWVAYETITERDAMTTANRSSPSP